MILIIIIIKRNKVKQTCSNGINLTKPLQTFRSFPSPTSICSTYNDSASGCFSHLTILPILMSSLLTFTSSGASSSSKIFCYYLTI